MKKVIPIAILLIALGLVTVISTRNLEPRLVDGEKSSLLPNLELKNPFKTGEALLVRELAWNSWQEYFEAVQSHDLARVRQASHQISEACSNPERETECFALMDNLVEFAKDFKKENFPTTLFDDKQIILAGEYDEMKESETTWFERKVLYFTRDGLKVKVLGIRLCATSDLAIQDDCTPQNLDSKNEDGWWPEVSSLFHPA